MIAALTLNGDARLIVAILLGIFIGFVIVKSELAWRRNIIDLFNLSNGKGLTTILFALALGVVGFVLLREYGVVTLQVKTSYLWGPLAGGVLCGLGLILCGAAPTTAVAALGTGRIYSIWSLAGMVLALPLLHMLKNLFDNQLAAYSAPLRAQLISDLFTIGHVAWYVAGGLLLLWAAVYFFIGNQDE